MLEPRVATFPNEEQALVDELLAVLRKEFPHAHFFGRSLEGGAWGVETDEKNATTVFGYASFSTGWRRARAAERNSNSGLSPDEARRLLEMLAERQRAPYAVLPGDAALVAKLRASAGIDVRDLPPGVVVSADVGG